MGSSRSDSFHDHCSTDRFPICHRPHIPTLVCQGQRRRTSPRSLSDLSVERLLPFGHTLPPKRLHQLSCCCLHNLAPEVLQSQQGRRRPESLAQLAHHRRKAMAVPCRFQSSRLYPRPPLGIDGSPRSEAGYSHLEPDRCTLIGGSAKAGRIDAPRRSHAASEPSRSGN